MLDGYHQLSKELQNMLGEGGGGGGGGRGGGREREGERGGRGERGGVGRMEVEAEVKRKKSIHHSYSYKLNKHTLQT